MEARQNARRRGLALAAKLTGIGGLTLALTGAVDARADEKQPDTTDIANVKGEMPSGVQVNGGDCGCSPCWGPPAPPPRGFA